MKVRCELSFEYPSKHVASTVLQATKVDDQGFVTSSVKEKSIHATIEAESVSSLMHTLDDYLSCVSVAEQVVNKS